MIIITTIIIIIIDITIVVVFVVFNITAIVILIIINNGQFEKRRLRFGHSGKVSENFPYFHSKGRSVFVFVSSYRDC